MPSGSGLEPLLTNIDAWFYASRTCSALIASGIGLIVLVLVEWDRNDARRLRTWKIVGGTAVLMLPVPLLGVLLSERMMQREVASLVLPNSASESSRVPETSSAPPPDEVRRINPALAVSVAGGTIGMIGGALLVIVLWRGLSLIRELDAGRSRAEEWR